MALALVTGATAGIGATFARHLAARGDDVILVARDESRLAAMAHDLSAEFEVTCEILPADLSQRDDTLRIAERLADAEKPVDILINNAGFGLHSSMVDSDLDIHDRAFDLMIKAVFILGNAAGKAMKSRGKGLIINTGSSAACLTQGNYSAIKSWVNNYSESLYCELFGTGVHVVCLAPGWVRTEFHERAGIKSNKLPSFVWCTADEVVAETLKHAAKGKVFSVPTKRWAFAVWAAHHLAPRALIYAASRKLMSSRKGR